jgi:hypothetical protein
VSIGRGRLVRFAWWNPDSHIRRVDEGRSRLLEIGLERDIVRWVLAVLSDAVRMARQLQCSKGGLLKQGHGSEGKLSGRRKGVSWWNALGWERRNLLGVVSAECLGPAIEIQRELGLPRANKGSGKTAAMSSRASRCRRETTRFTVLRAASRWEE